MVGSKIETIMAAHCPYCNALRNCMIKGYYGISAKPDSGSLWFDFYLLVCQDCDNVFFQTEEEIPEVLTYSDGRVDYKTTFNISTWPSPPKRTTPEWYEKYKHLIGIYYSSSLSFMLGEVYGAYDNNFTVLASTGIRTCFDIVSTSLGIDPNLTFTEKLEKLRDGGHVTEIEKDILAVLVEAGNASAHRGWFPNSEEIRVLLNILENFIENTIIKPLETKILVETAATIKEKIPPRPPRSPQKK